MAAVVIVGAGLAGLAAAARLAKLGHAVTVCERGPRVGGACHAVHHDGFTWDAGPATFTLPAVVRDLFRKSGRPLERYLTLQLVAPARRHVFDDGSVLDLPTGSRGAQSAAVEESMGTKTAAAWTRFCDQQGDVWKRLRATVLDPPEGGAALSDRRVARSVGGKASLARRLRKDLPDPRLRQVAAYPFPGSRARDVPAYGAVQTYVERTFGVWRVAEAALGSALPDVLTTRLQERRVTVDLQRPVAAILTHRSRVVGVGLADGDELPADHVVTTLDPRQVLGSWVDNPAVSSARAAFEGASTAPVPHVTHLGLSGDAPDLPEEVVLHGEPLVVLRTGGQAPPGQHAWTVLQWRTATDNHGPGSLDPLDPPDPLALLRDRGLDVATQVVTRVDRTPAEVAGDSGATPTGLAWTGAADYARRARFTNPMPGLHLVGASVHPGPGLPYVMWGAAHVAERIGKARTARKT